jgi:hypothetical protein
MTDETTKSAPKRASGLVRGGTVPALEEFLR